MKHFPFTNLHFNSLTLKSLYCLLLITPSFLFANSSRELIDSRDGNRYKIITLGKQLWLAKNASFITPDSLCPQGNKSLCDSFGRIYNWYDALHACPSGTHLPTDNDMSLLENYVNGNSSLLKAFKYSKEKNNAGFNAQPGGYRDLDGIFLISTRKLLFGLQVKKMLVMHLNAGF